MASLLCVSTIKFWVLIFLCILINTWYHLSFPSYPSQWVQRGISLWFCFVWFYLMRHINITFLFKNHFSFNSLNIFMIALIKSLPPKSNIWALSKSAYIVTFKKIFPVCIDYILLFQKHVKCFCCWKLDIGYNLLQQLWVQILPWVLLMELRFVFFLFICLEDG